MPNHSAGILLYQRRARLLHVLLAHPGGPFWARRDAGAWTIPKGGIGPGETAEDTARREFAEELGALPAGPLQPLGSVRQRGGKWVEAFALEGAFDAATVRSNEFEIEWPPHSGRMARFAEIDRAGWFPIVEARRRILPGQEALLDRLEALLAAVQDVGLPR